MLAMILESVTGAAFDEYLRDCLFIPCGMTSTGYYELDRLPAKCASNYIYDAETQTYRTDIFSVDAKARSGRRIYDFIGDISDAWEHLMSGKVISPDMTANMTENHSGDARCYGYGIWLRSKRNLFPLIFREATPESVLSLLTGKRMKLSSLWSAITEITSGSFTES